MIKYSELKNILKQHSLRVTDCRMDVLEYFIKSSQAFSFKNLEDEFEQYDRVTLYRTLNSFTENGVFHKIPSDTGTVTYGVCSTTCSPLNHNHNHMHFQCNCCGKIECLAEDHLPEVKLPHYEVMEINMILKGICPQCI